MRPLVFLVVLVVMSLISVKLADLVLDSAVGPFDRTLAFFYGNLMPMASVVMPLWALEITTSPLLIGLIVSSRQFLVVAFSIYGGALHDRADPRAVILLLAIVAAITLTMRKRPGLKQQNISKQVAVRAEDRVRLVKMPAEKPAGGGES